jgi:DNA-binding transcriptional LysR family regulator
MIWSPSSGDARHGKVGQDVIGELFQGYLRVLPDHKVGDQTALWLIYPKSNVLTAKVRIFIDFLREKTANTPAWTRA